MKYCTHLDDLHHSIDGEIMWNERIHILDDEVGEGGKILLT